MTDFHIKYIDRGNERSLWLFSDSARDYELLESLPAVPSADAHMRWHPLLREWVCHAGARQGRTFLPDAADCPLCPASKGGKLTDMPATDYEIAIFTNRFSALSAEAGTSPELGIKTVPGIGFCDVVCYSADHNSSFATIGVDRISLLIAAIGHRWDELMQDDRIQYVLPFENRGREIGVTLDHPHGQIYALSHVPALIAREAESFATANPLDDIGAQINPDLILAQNECGLVMVPEWGRYPFETWVVPHRRMASPAEFNANERIQFAALIHDAVSRLDAVHGAPMPYTLGWHTAPRGMQDSFHFYCAFRPLRRSADKLKYLASVEQITGTFLVDIPPEQAAELLAGRLTSNA